MSIILDGKAVAKEIEQQLTERVKKAKSTLGYTPILATILVGEDPASITYVKMKKRACERIGLESEIHQLPAESTTNDIVDLINQLNKEETVCGILLQHPVPKHIDENLCFDTISPEKDVDGVTSVSLGRTQKGKNILFSSATPTGIMTLLKHYNIPLKGKKVVVVGRSDILGKPSADLFTNEDCTVTLCHSKTSPEDLDYYLKNADIVVGAVNIPNFIKSDQIKKGAIIIDAGYIGNTGCVDFSTPDKDGLTITDKCEAHTPVPGGVGPMTISTLISNAAKNAENKAQKIDKETKKEKLKNFILNNCPTIVIK